MRQKISSFIVTVLLGISIIFNIGFLLERGTKNQVVQEKTLVSIPEIQQLLNELETDNPIAVDGKLGKQTQDKWDRVYCQQCVNKYFK